MSDIMLMEQMPVDMFVEGISNLLGESVGLKCARTFSDRGITGFVENEERMQVLFEVLKRDPRIIKMNIGLLVGVEGSVYSPPFDAQESHR